ncbi:MAG: hypothetical protein AAF518_19280, partial [Spirochaetota bacterium]
QIPSKEFSILFQKPFFVIGDLKPNILKDRWARGTIRWTVKRLKSLYFSKDPNKILAIWLFKDNTSYRKYTKQIWNSVPDTPYGYYSPYHKALVMNIATGGGTLVHEIVHPFMEANFPECPDWFNEGMGSLYEQSGERKGRIMGLTNWRLAGLQESIRDKELMSFRELTEIEGFYDKEDGYGMARYLCYYLQSKRLLVTYYKEFTQNVAKDPSGYKTLQKVLQTTDMDKFQKKWEAWVMQLKFPPST